MGVRSHALRLSGRTSCIIRGLAVGPKEAQCVAFVMSVCSDTSLPSAPPVRIEDDGNNALSEETNSDGISDVSLPDGQSDHDCMEGESDSLPDNVEEETCEDFGEAFVDEAEEQDAMKATFHATTKDRHNVPLPTECNLLGSHDIAEVYSPPRLLPTARRLGLSGTLSCDILTGWDFSQTGIKAKLFQLLVQLNIFFIMMSPTCTMFSALQALWNFKRMSRDVIDRRMKEALGFIEHCMALARVQIERSNFFCFEHPASSSAWKLECVQEVSRLPGVFKITFDQCQCGLVTPLGRRPMRKRTILMSNAYGIRRNFSNLMCRRDHEHQLVMNSEGGMKLSVWAQLYPQPMIERLVESAAELRRNRGS